MILQAIQRYFRLEVMPKCASQMSILRAGLIVDFRFGFFRYHQSRCATALIRFEYHATAS